MFNKRLMALSSRVQMQCNWRKGRAGRWRTKQQQSDEYIHTELQAVRRLLQRLCIVLILFCRTQFCLAMSHLLWFPDTGCSLPLPDSSRTTIISVDGSIVEAHSSSTAFPRTVLWHLLARLVGAVSLGNCLLMLVRLKATSYIHVARMFLA
jgi:hypothetical protein